MTATLAQFGICQSASPDAARLNFIAQTCAASIRARYDVQQGTVVLPHAG